MSYLSGTEEPPLVFAWKKNEVTSASNDSH